MQRGADSSAGGLGPQLVGEKIVINRRAISVVRQLGEGECSRGKRQRERVEKSK